jgi:hypothetical protein
LTRIGLLAVLIAVVSAAGCRHPRLGEYPVGIYGAPAEALPMLRDAGFNLVRGSASREYLDAARRAGLGVLASPLTSAGFDFSATAARRAVQAYDRHPALWAWYLADEPDMHGVPPFLIRDAHRYMKTIGARKPTALVLYNGFEAPAYAGIPDILMIDRYPVPWMPLETFDQHVRLARHALRDSRQPLIAVIQAFDWRYYPEQMPIQKENRPPTYEELRCMTYCALVQQARGLFYYAYDDGRWRLAQQPETWQAVQQVVAEVRRMEPLFAGRHIWWAWRRALKYRDGPRWNSVQESSVIVALVQVKAGTWNVPEGYYVVSVNTTPETHRLRLYLPFPGNPIAPVWGEDRVLVADENWVADDFAPYAVHLYGPLAGP